MAAGEKENGCTTEQHWRVALAYNLSQLVLRIAFKAHEHFCSLLRPISPSSKLSKWKSNNINFYGLLIVEDAFTMQFLSFPFIDTEL